MDPPPSTVLHQDSLESSSPSCRQWDDSLPPPKLRMMCSYGGHIIPRPHDKSLCYMGGETRIVVADRNTCLADLCSRLSTTLLHGRQFSLKYQLPSEDLDSLVSVTTDEDLDNMVEEYDRLNSSNPSAKPSRLRLFLFLTKPETAASMGSLLDDAKSETWFVDALNGAGLLPRGLSDPATIDNLLEPKDGENIQDESELQRRLPDSPLMETTSSFGSSSSSPSMSNLPPIKVRVDHKMAGLDEQLSQLNVTAPVHVNDETIPSGGMMTRKPPLPLQPVQRKFGNDAYSLPSPDSKHGGAYGLHSPDSIASDSSIASSKPTLSQDPNKDTPTTQFFPQIQVQQTPNSTDTQPKTQHQNRPHYINQPISSYYHPQIMDHQQYPLYFLPVSQNHQYAGMQMQMQSNPSADAIASSTTTQTIVPLTKSDMVANPLYTTTPQAGMIQFQQQYMNISQIPPTQMPTSNGVNYGYDYAHPTQEHVYYHSVAPPLPSQYQTMTPASAMLLTQMPSSQQPVEEIAKQLL